MHEPPRNVTVLREMPKRSATARVVGSRAPGKSRRATIALRILREELRADRAAATRIEIEVGERGHVIAPRQPSRRIRLLRATRLDQFTKVDHSVRRVVQAALLRRYRDER